MFDTFQKLLAVVALVVLTSGSAFAGSRALQSACFADDVLHAIDGERQPVKGDHDFDKFASAKDELAPHTAIDPGMRGAIRRVDLPKGEKLIALTFDLCEQRGEVAGYDGDIFDYLRRENVKATLFAGGKWMRSHQARTEQLMTDPLFELANHSETHRNLRLLDSAEVQNEINAPQRAFEHARQRLSSTQCAANAPEGLAAIPPRLTMFRFPFGACNAASLAAVNDAGLLAIQWDLSTGDPDPHQSAAAIANAMIHYVHPGSIIIGHGNGRGWNTAAALPIAIPKLKAMGYQFVTVSELLARGTPVITDTCYDSHPGDTDRYDFLSGLHGKGKVPGQHPGEPDALPSAPTVDAQAQSAPSHKPEKANSGSLTPSLSWPF
jgi:peptidoglycan/xylan/chitin deacetylase (PgdA/CDA1 family)